MFLTPCCIAGIQELWLIPPLATALAEATPFAYLIADLVKGAGQHKFVDRMGWLTTLRARRIS
jgi:hypothetical protein